MFTEIWRYVIATSEWQDLERNSTCPTMSLQWRTFSPAVLTDLDCVLASQDSRHLRRLRLEWWDTARPWSSQGQSVQEEQPRVWSLQRGLISVREFARSQGFADSFQFSGTIRDRHSEIGNAVPPPGGWALGLKIRKAVCLNETKTGWGYLYLWHHLINRFRD